MYLWKDNFPTGTLLKEYYSFIEYLCIKEIVKMHLSLFRGTELPVTHINYQTQCISSLASVTVDGSKQFCEYMTYSSVGIHCKHNDTVCINRTTDFFTMGTMSQQSSSLRLLTFLMFSNKEHMLFYNLVTAFINGLAESRSRNIISRNSITFQGPFNHNLQFPFIHIVHKG